MMVSRQNVERALAWVRDFREQVERMDGDWLPMGFAHIPSVEPLLVLEQIAREALEREMSGGDKLPNVGDR